MCKSYGRDIRSSGRGTESRTSGKFSSSKATGHGRTYTDIGQGEKNKLQDANTELDVELKDVRAQLADSVKGNKRL